MPDKTHPKKDDDVDNRSEAEKKRMPKEIAGQFVRTRKGAKNDGTSSAEPRVLSGDEGGDATFPLKQDSR